MAKKMLIDATHAEETRVVVVDGNKVEEFDFESVNKRQLAGNIYLAKVTRVEPSLQAAFVDYGGNRHGFLAFSEIHPDYYQIPVADREALLAEDRAYAKSHEEDEEKPAPKKRRSRRKVAEPAPVVEETVADAAESSPAPVEEVVAADPVAEDISAVASEDTAPEAVVETDTDSGGDEPAASEEAGEGEGEKTPSPMAMAVEDDDPVVTREVTETGEPVEAALPETDTAAAEEKPKPKRKRAPRKKPAPKPAPKPVAEAPAEDAPQTPVEASEPVADEQPGIGGMDIVDLGGDDSSDPVEGFAPDEDKTGPDAAAKDETIESVADEDTEEDFRRARKPRPRRYKIQEVVKVRQIMLVQVVKEERGNKGAALTTYLSLAGRYCVLMPNTARGGGISRKITNAADRKKLKEIASSIAVPEGAGLIVRTAGAKRTKAEIKRDYEYLQRLWEQIRDLTLKSIAPAPIYEEGNLIKRSIRDLYNREIDEVLIEGDVGFRTAKEFMKMLMPSHARHVKHYVEPQPLFAKFGVESYLAAMFNPTVQLRSGGYIVIGVTEALVAIDVNSGRATKEGSIEETALKTNLEASDEVARQLRLRDLAGLIVIDYIDMEDRRNNAAVEKRFKDRLKSDRARIQVGRISGFGLMEMSRQRLRPGMLEATTQPCPACHGTGLIRSDDSIGLAIIRQLEEEAVRRRSREVLLKAPVAVVNFLFNTKREHIAQIESRYGLSVRMEGDPHMVAPDFTIEKFKTATRFVQEVASPVISIDTEVPENEEEEAEAIVEAEVIETEEDDDTGDRSNRKRRRRRRGGRKSPDETTTTGEDTAEAVEAAEDAGQGDEAPAEDETEGEGGDKRRRRRSRRGGRGRRRAPRESQEQEAEATVAPEASEVPETVEADPQTPVEVEAAAPDQPDPVEAVEPEAVVEEPLRALEVSDAGGGPPPAPAAIVAEPVAVEAVEPEVVAELEPEPEPAPVVAATVAEPEPEAPKKPKRRGWWSRG